ncbi:glycoside hydrolase family 9 protein [Actinosynnema pretiosum subsp. pretiosum]|uniref:Endoglucanase n=1 Tax=Actinosynnema pretiosum subsp. pretiosum TaxID=103721 RepID=A0AA45L4Q7_9PSEU|nr:glycoside hydrolase family 9 protein [Actinosynnema pretiosum subsp. pretiosum]
MRPRTPAPRRATAISAALALLAAAATAPPATAQPDQRATPDRAQSPSVTQAYERIVNGSFASGTADPWWAGSGVTNRLVDGELCARVPGGTANPWDALIGQNGVPFEAGQQYVLAFTARADRARPAAAALGEGVSPYRQIAKHDVQLTTERQSFTFTFTSDLDFPDAGAGQLTFHLGALAEESTVCVDDVSLVGGVKPPGGEPTGPSRKVLVDQVGYLPKGPKRATALHPSTSPQPWTLTRGGATVARGTTTPKPADAASGDPVHLIDFSAVETEGEGYVLTVGEESSFPFDIGASHLGDLRTDALKFFYHQRSGTPIEAAHVGETYARPAGHVDVAPNKGDGAVGCLVDCGYTLDVRGGWYDAGDHGKYVVNGGISVWQVLNSYERAKLKGTEAALGDGKLNIPESGNGVPDVLDEARWEVEFLLRMQAPDGMVHHKIHDVNWTGLPLLPHQDPQARRLSPTSTAATLNTAAVAAQAARLWRSVDPAFADRALAAAERAYAAAKANPAKLADPNDATGGGAYNDNDVSDEFYWAAAELLTTTGKSGYRADVTSSPHYKAAALNGRGIDWAYTAPLGDVTLALVPNGLPAADVAATRARFAQVADGMLAQAAAQNYPAPYDTVNYDWGSNGLVANNGGVLGIAFDLTGQAKYRDGAFEALHYLLGRNPVGYSYVTGYGEQPVRNVHHRHWANQLDPSLPIAPPGVLSGGPNSALQDPIAARLLQGCAPQKCFVDHIEAYSVNEVTVNWNSALVWLATWAAEVAEAPQQPEGGCSVSYQANSWQGGFTANLVVRNTGATPWTAWELGFSFPGDQRITQSWSGVWSQEGNRVRATNAAWNGAVRPGGSVTLGFNGSHGGTNQQPAAFTVNGARCSAG